MEQAARGQVREKIEAVIRVTEQDIASLVELTRPIAPDNAIGRLSRLEAIGAKAINEAALDTARQKLARLKYALSAIDNPGFGTCMDCGEPIPLARVMVVPESNLCVGCAE